MKTTIHIICTILISSIIVLLFQTFSPKPKIAYIDSGKLLISFSESAKIQNELKAEEEKWQKDLKILQDSLKTAVDIMSNEYDNATPARKKDLQDNLSARNQQINNFCQANLRKMDEMRQKKMTGVVEKINIFVAEYGKKKHYSVILGTGPGGNIIFGNQAYDITDEVAAGLNERYK